MNQSEGREIIRAQPYSARSKPIEALFRRLDDYCFSALPGYTGGNRMAKKTQNVGREPEPWSKSWEEFTETVGGLIGNYHQRKVGGQWGNRSPDEVFSQKIADGWRPTLPRPYALEMAFCDTVQKKLTKQGIRHSGRTYTHPQLNLFTIGATIELIVPWRKDVPPIVVLPSVGPVKLVEDYLYPANDLDGAREAKRRQQGYKAAVATMSRQQPEIDPVGVKLRIAKRIGQAAIPGGTRFLDHGASIHEFIPAGPLIEHQPLPEHDAATRRREAEKARTERLIRAKQHGR